MVDLCRRGLCLAARTTGLAYKRSIGEVSDWLLVVTSFCVKRGRRPSLARKTRPLGVKIMCGLSKKDIVSIATQPLMAKRACSAALRSESPFLYDVCVTG